MSLSPAVQLQVRTSPAPTTDRPRRLAWFSGPRRWLWVVLIGQLVAQLLLLTPIAAVRAPLRVLAFSFSLLTLFAVRRPGPRHPVMPWLVASLAVMVAGLFHPDTDSFLAGFASIALALAIFGPVSWTARLGLDADDLNRALIFLWAFHFASAVFGVLQVKFPGHFQPELSSAILAKGDAYVHGLEFTLPSGETVFRPMGLTDVPGGAAGSGYYLVLIGIGLGWLKRGVWRALAVVGMFLGLVCLYLSHVRVSIAALAIALVVLGAILAVRRQWTRLVRLVILVAAVASAGLTYSLILGGDSVAERLGTLVDDEPSDVYYSNRGRFLEYTFEVLIGEYPFGAGLGRWGPLSGYFGSDPDSALWAEIQWTGWLYDGGVPLMLLMAGALLTTILFGLKLALRPRLSPDLAAWVPVLIGYNVASLAITFSYPMFVGQSGMEFWILNGLLFAAASRESAGTGFGTKRPAVRESMVRRLGSGDWASAGAARR